MHLTFRSYRLDLALPECPDGAFRLTHCEANGTIQNEWPRVRSGPGFALILAASFGECHDQRRTYRANCPLLGHRNRHHDRVLPDRRVADEYLVWTPALRPSSPMP